MKQDKPFDRSVYRTLLLVSQFGMNMIAPIGMTTALGVWLDGKFHTGWITIVLFMAGAVAGGQNIYRMAKRYMTDHEQAGVERASNRAPEKKE